MNDGFRGYFHLASLTSLDEMPALGFFNFSSQHFSLFLDFASLVVYVIIL